MPLSTTSSHRRSLNPFTQASSQQHQPKTPFLPHHLPNSHPSHASLSNSIKKSNILRRYFIRNRLSFPLAAKLAAIVQIQRVIRGFLQRSAAYRASYRKASIGGSGFSPVSPRSLKEIQGGSSTRESSLSNDDVQWMIQRWRFSMNRQDFQHLVFYRKFSVYEDAALAIQKQYRTHKGNLIRKYGKKCFIDRRKRLRFYDSAHDSAATVQRAWRRFLNRQIFHFYRDLIRFREMGDPREMLKSINPREASLLDRASGVHVRFRLGGTKFPPAVYYKIFVHSPLVDINAFAPRDYTKYKHQKNPEYIHNKGVVPEDTGEGWYERVENNGWRSLASSIATISEQEDEVAGTKNVMYHRLKEERAKEKRGKMKHHFSKLNRKQDVLRRKKQKRIEWMRKMYNMASKKILEKSQKERTIQQSAIEDSDVFSEQGSQFHDTEKFERVEKQIHQIMNHPLMNERVSHDSIPVDTNTRKLLGDLGLEEDLDPEVNDILNWCESLNYDAYEADWKMLATSAGTDTQHLSTQDKLQILESSNSRPAFSTQMTQFARQNADQELHMNTRYTNDDPFDEMIHHQSPSAFGSQQNFDRVATSNTFVTSTSAGEDSAGLIRAGSVTTDISNTSHRAAIQKLSEIISKQAQSDSGHLKSAVDSILMSGSTMEEYLRARDEVMGALESLETGDAAR